MSLFDDDQYRWRETYFVLFDPERRPLLSEVEARLKGLNARFELSGGRVDDAGRIESLTLLSPHDSAALDITYLSGEEVMQETSELLKELQPIDDEEQRRLARARKLTGRFDVMHFEYVQADVADEEEEGDVSFDPSALLIVLDALTEMTDGVAFDPQSGCMM